MRTQEGGPGQPLPEPMPLARIGVAADGIVLVGQPHDEDDVEGSGGVIEELGHDGLHPCGTKQLHQGHGRESSVTSEQGLGDRAAQATAVPNRSV